MENFQLPSKLPPSKPVSTPSVGNNLGATSDPIQKLKARQAEKKANNPYTKYFKGVETGSRFDDRARLGGLKKRFSKFRTYAKAVSKNVSTKDAARMEAILKDKLEHYRTGAELGLKQRKKIMREAWKQSQKKGVKDGFSRADIKDFRKIVDTIIDSNE